MATSHKGALDKATREQVSLLAGTAAANRIKEQWLAQQNAAVKLSQKLADMVKPKPAAQSPTVAQQQQQQQQQQHQERQTDSAQLGAKQESLGDKQRSYKCEQGRADGGLHACKQTSSATRGKPLRTAMSGANDGPVVGLDAGSDAHSKPHAAESNK